MLTFRIELTIAKKSLSQYLPLSLLEPILVDLNEFSGTGAPRLSDAARMQTKTEVMDFIWITTATCALEVRLF